MKRLALWLGIPLLVSLIIFTFSYGGAWAIRGGVERIPVITSDPDWTQAIGAVLAIVGGFAGVIYQVQRQKADAQAQEDAAGRAAYLIAYDAFETVTERLDAALTPEDNKGGHRLRGNRTNEMVAAMRQFEISRIPAAMLADFIRLRSRVYAVNERITELYEDERDAGEGRPALEASRYRWLTSAVTVWNDAVVHFEQLETVAKAIGANAQTLTRPDSIKYYERPPSGPQDPPLDVPDVEDQASNEAQSPTG